MENKNNMNNNNGLFGVDLMTLRSCSKSGKTMREADLGLGLMVKYANNKKVNIEVRPGSYVSRQVYNEGIRKVEARVQPYPLVTVDGNYCNAFLPLTLVMQGHCIRPLDRNAIREKAKVQEKKQGPPTNYYFLLDYSGSMSGQYITQCVNSLKTFIQDTVQERDSVYLATFENHYKVRLPLLKKHNNMKQIEKIINECVGPQGGTAFYDAIHQCLSHLDQNHRAIIVALTDGEDNQSKPNRLQDLHYAFQELAGKKPERQFYVITVGPLPTAAVLDNLCAQLPGSVRIAAGGSAQEIAQAYKAVSKRILSASDPDNDDDALLVGTSDLIASAFSLIATGENGNFNQDLIWKVCGTLLNLFVVKFARKEIPVTAESVRDYQDIHRTVMFLLEQHPDLKETHQRALISFSDPKKPNNRARDKCPDLGEFLQTITFSDTVTWDPSASPNTPAGQFIRAFIQELFRRNARWCPLVKNAPGNDDASKLRELEIYFEKMKVSLTLVAFNILFLQHVIRIHDRSPAEAVNYYDQHLTYMNEEQLNVFLEKCQCIFALDNFPDMIHFLGLSNTPDDILDLIYYGHGFSQEPKMLEEMQQSAQRIVPARNIQVMQVQLNPKAGNLPVNMQAPAPGNDMPDFKKALHVGYTLSMHRMDPDDREILETTVAPTVLKSDFYTAMVYGKPQAGLAAPEYYGKERQGNFTGYFKQNNHVVGVLNLEREQEGFERVYIVLTDAPKPAEWKQKAARGQLGPEIPFARSLPVNCVGTVKFP